MTGFGSEDFDLTQEPRKVFVNFLIFNMKLIEQKIFFDGEATSAIRPLRGLIKSLDSKSQKRLKPQLDRLLRYERDIRLCSREEIEHTYGEVSTYLHATYLKEAFYARPRHPKRGKLGERNDGEE